ncbi:MAG: hypothetical protein WCF22_06000 [Candidatus Sulfotelmatobacter sp.]
MQSWKKYLGRGVVALLIFVLILYIADSIVVRIRVARGTAYSSVEVDQFLATPLKGQKVEYDMVGSFKQPCARSIFPHGGKPACWWVRRHNAVWE